MPPQTKHIEDLKTGDTFVGYPDASDGGNLYFNALLGTYPMFIFRKVYEWILLFFVDLGNSLTFIDIPAAVYIRQNTTQKKTLFRLSYEGHLTIWDAGSYPPPVESGTIKLYSVAGEAVVMDDSGNTTTISPHNTEGIPDNPAVSYPVAVHHRNDFLGVEQWIDLAGLAMEIEQLTGKTFIYTQSVPVRDWTQAQLDMQATRQAEIAAYDARRQEYIALPPHEQVAALRLLGDRPQRYTPEPIPEWINSRI